MSSVRCSVLPLWLLWGAACAAAAAGTDNAFPFDIEGSSAVGRQDPPETSEPRVAPGRLPPAAKVQCPCHRHPAAAPAPRGRRTPVPVSPLFFPSPILPESFTCTRSVQKLEEFYFVKLDLDVVSCELRLWNMSLFKLAEVHVSCVLGASLLRLSPGAAVALL